MNKGTIIIIALTTLVVLLIGFIGYLSFFDNNDELRNNKLTFIINKYDYDGLKKIYEGGETHSRGVCFYGRELAKDLIKIEKIDICSGGQMGTINIRKNCALTTEEIDETKKEGYIAIMCKSGLMVYDYYSAEYSYAVKVEEYK